jgi:hypothetical protein
MKTVNLYLDMEFTSLSPDAQPISLGIVSDEADWRTGIKTANLELRSKSFYAEFSDFDINRCDDWVKENVVKKLKYQDYPHAVSFVDVDTGSSEYNHWDKKSISNSLKLWLGQFSEYQIQFVVDCGTWDWYHFLQLIGEWDKKEEVVIPNIHDHKDIFSLDRHSKEIAILNKAKGREIVRFDYNGSLSNNGYGRVSIINRTGLPKLPSNISPVPLDLNDLIAFKKRITTKEAFDLNREELLISDVSGMQVTDASTLNGEPIQKHNALFDAKVIKEVFNYINQQ